MSMNFDDKINPEASALIAKYFGDKADQVDDRTVLLDTVNLFNQKNMKEIANAAGQPVVVELHGEGDIKTLSDGTRYRVTRRGWVRLDDQEDA